MIMATTLGFAQDILVAEYKFETNQQGWAFQAYSSLGATSSSPTSGWISTVNWSLHGGSAGCIRHNITSAAGSWFGFSPTIALEAGAQYYVKFGVTLSGANSTATNVNHRAQVRWRQTDLLANTSLNNYTILMGSTYIPISTANASANYVELTSPVLNAAVTGNYRFAVGNFFGSAGHACYFDGIRIFKVVPPENTWQGDVSSDWNNPSNWSNNVVPVASDQVVIPQVTLQNVYPVLSGISSSISTLTVNAGASFSIEGSAALTISGLLTNNGTITTSSGAALVQTNSSTLAGSGIFNIQRTMPLAGPSNTFRYIGSPINSIAAGSFGIAATGVNGGQVIPLAGCSPTAVANNSAFGNIIELRENATPVNNCAQSLWHVKSAGVLENGRGYCMKVNPGATYTFSGTINNGNVPVNNLSSSPGTLNDHIAGPGQTRGWHLLANPYPSPILLTAANRTSQGFNAQIQIWNPNGTWVSYVGDATIAVGQAFAIKNSTGTNQNFLFTNAMRVPTANASFFDAAENGMYGWNISVNGNNFEDNTTVRFSSSSLFEFDTALDANKLPGNVDQPTLFTMAGTHRMSINTVPNLIAQQSIPMAFAPGTAGTYTLFFDAFGQLPSTMQLYLRDLKTGEIRSLSNNNSYTFTSDANDDVNRFELIIEPPLSVSVSNETCLNATDGKVIVSNNQSESITVQLVHNGVIQTAKTIESNSNDEFQNIQTGTYELRFIKNGMLFASEWININSGIALNSDFVVNSSVLNTDQTLNALVSNPTENAVYKWFINDIPQSEGSAFEWSTSQPGAYTLKLVAEAATCLHSAEQTITFNASNTLSLDHIKTEVFSLYPVPANDVVYVSFNTTTNGNQFLQLFDLTGKLITSENISKGQTLSTIQLSNLSSGSYLVKLIDSNGTSLKTQLLIVAH